MTSSSSTESGCEGSVDGNTDNDSSDDRILDQIDDKEPNNSPNIILEDNQKNDQNYNKTPDRNKEINSNASADDAQIEKANVVDANKTFIDDILKEFDSPASIYIPNKKNNEGEEENQNMNSEAATEVTERSTLATRRTSGAKASQIIKENSEILERIMKKRIQSMSGQSEEIAMSLRNEEIDKECNKDKKEINEQLFFPDKSKDKHNSSNTYEQYESPNILSQSNPSNHLPKKDAEQSNNPQKPYPSLSPMGPVKQQLAKPQVNPIGGMVVQQRSDVRMGGHNCAKPITFNPFPNSSRIGQRKSNEVGRKLGLYPAAK